MARKLTLRGMVTDIRKTGVIVATIDSDNGRSTLLIRDEFNYKQGDLVTLVWIDGKYQIAKEKAA